MMYPAPEVEEGKPHPYPYAREPKLGPVSEGDWMLEAGVRLEKDVDGQRMGIYRQASKNIGLTSKAERLTRGGLKPVGAIASEPCKSVIASCRSGIQPTPQTGDISDSTSTSWISASIMWAKQPSCSRPTLDEAG